MRDIAEKLWERQCDKLRQRIAELEAERRGFIDDAFRNQEWIQEQADRLAELEDWIRNKRDSNFEFACKNIDGWTKDKDSFYAECTEILEGKC